MSAETQALGLRGEKIAHKWLREYGWVVLTRRFRSGHRDIDLVACQPLSEGRMVAFVEVKARLSDAFGGPIGAVNWRKQRELGRSAMVWMARFQRPGDQFRFDIIGVLIGKGTVRVKHIENAFFVPTRT